MAKICPVTGDYVLYLDCMECEEKECEAESVEENKGE